MHIRNCLAFVNKNVLLSSPTLADGIFSPGGEAHRKELQKQNNTKPHCTGNLDVLKHNRTAMANRNEGSSGNLNICTELSLWSLSADLLRGLG